MLYIRLCTVLPLRTKNKKMNERNSPFPIPPSFYCVISFEIMQDPVLLGTTGHTFDRRSIEDWLRNHDTNPSTNERLSPENRILIPNLALRDAIKDFIDSATGKIIPFSEITLGNRLGSGIDKDVFKGKWNGVDVAILIFRHASLSTRETRICLRLGFHQHLIRFYGRTVSRDGGENQEANALVSEYAPLGNLSNCLAHLRDIGKSLTTDHLLVIAEQIADGMTRIHSLEVLHRDLAARNVMVFNLNPDNASQTLVKVGDYGLAEVVGMNGYMRGSASSPMPVRWMSPDTIRRRCWSKASDVWSFGVVLWEIFNYGDYPYNYVTSDDTVASGVIEGTLSLSRPEPCPEEVWQLMQACFLRDPERRPPFTEIKLTIQRIRSSPLTYPTPPPSSSVYPRPSVDRVLVHPPPAHGPNVSPQKGTTSHVLPLGQAGVGMYKIKLLVIGDSCKSILSSPLDSSRPHLISSFFPAIYHTILSSITCSCCCTPLALFYDQL
jgi:serine/threonine protein kinase